MALALACTAGGCAIVPTNGTPVPAKEESTSNPLSQPYVRIIASAPKPGGQPQEIVDGFRAAMASVDDPDWKIARQYLTSEALATWHPEAGVTVYDQSGQSSTPGEDEAPERRAIISLRGTVVATIDPDGRYSDLQPSGIERDIPFGITKVGTEWRISSPPPGLLLSSADVQRAYRTFDLYYPDVSRRWLVADQVTVPIDPSKSQAETLVRRLLKGPGRSLRGAVANVLPVGTRLIRVAPDGDSVIVDFTSEMGSLIDPDRLRAASAQLAWTLRQLVPGPIQIRVNGEPLTGVSQSIKWGSYPSFNPATQAGGQAAYFMRAGVLHRISPEANHPAVEGAPGRTTGFTSPAVSGFESEAKVAALADHGGLQVAEMAAGSRWTEWLHGAKGTLTPPSWDRYGFVWTTENKENDLRVWAVKDGNPTRVAVPSELAVAHVSKLRVSRDGARVAMIVDSGDGPEVKVGAIMRNEDGRIERVDEIQKVIEAKEDQTIPDIAWKDGQRLVVLSGTKNGRVYTVYSITSGRSEAPKSAAPLTTISAAGDSILGSSAKGGEVLSWDSKKNRWKTEIKDGASTPVYPLG